MAAAIVYGITGKRCISVPSDESIIEDEVLDVATSANTKRLYRVSVLDQKGAFHDFANAQNLLKALESAGFKAIITEG